MPVMTGLPDFLDDAADASPTGKPEDHAGAVLVESSKESLFLADLAVISLSDLFKTGKVGIKLCLGRKGGSVNSLEGGVCLDSFPVGSRRGEKLDCPDLSRSWQMWSPTKVRKFTLIVDGNLGFGRNGVKNLQLERLSRFFEKFMSRFPRKGTADNGSIGGDDPPHLLFNLFEILRGKGPLKAEVVIEAFLGGGADAHLGGRKETFYGLGKYVGGAVPESHEVNGGTVRLPLGVVQGILSCCVFLTCIGWRFVKSYFLNDR